MNFLGPSFGPDFLIFFENFVQKVKIALLYTFWASSWFSSFLKHVNARFEDELLFQLRLRAPAVHGVSSYIISPVFFHLIVRFLFTLPQFTHLLDDINQ